MFKGYEKALKKEGYSVVGNQVVGPRGDVVAAVNPYGEVDTKEPAILKILAKPAKTKVVKEK